MAALPGWAAQGREMERQKHAAKARRSVNVSVRWGASGSVCRRSVVRSTILQDFSIGQSVALAHHPRFEYGSISGSRTPPEI